MADGEEDYSSLPLTDRWVHKVRGTRNTTEFGPYWYHEGKAGGGELPFGGCPVVEQSGC